MARRPLLDRELARYLVDGETVIVAVRLHWFHLGRELLLAAVASVFAFWVDVTVPMHSGGQYLHDLSLLLWWAAVLWLVWKVLNWRHEWFVATDKRFLLFYGFLRRKVAMMPLLKVTDMTYDRSLLGRLAGYGKFVLESAGRDQALSVINHVPGAETHYRAICTQLFGPRSHLRFAPGGYGPPAPPDAPPRDDGGPGGGGSPNGPDAGGPAGGGAAAGRPDEAVAVPAPGRTPESWYRSSNLREPSQLGDTGEIPVVRARHDEEQPLYPPPHWSERG